jgi:hypothetical protein
VTLVLGALTSSLGGWPTNPVPHDDPMIVHERAGTSQFVPPHAVQDTVHPPEPLATVVTDAGAPGPTGVVVNRTGGDSVDWLLI